MKIRRSARCGSTPAMIRKTIVFCFLVIPIILMGAPGAWAQPQYGGTLRIGVENQIYGFDPLKRGVLTYATHTVGSLIMEPLFDMGENGELTPRLGLSMTPSEDEKIWIIALRRGVTFHDGTPFNADAIVQHWERLLDPEKRFRGRVLLGVISSVEKVDEFTVRFHLQHPWKPFTFLMSLRRSKAFLIPSPKAVADDVQNRAPVGTGPFVFQSWKPGDRFVMTKNGNYWQAGKPYLDEIVVRVIPDPDTRYAALASGELDTIYMDRPAHIKNMMADSRFSTLIGEDAGAGVLIMNTRKPPLDDVRVRQALAHAWDQKKYIKMSFQDVVPFATHWYGDVLTCNDVSYRYPDLEKAGALLREYGKPVELEYIHSATQRGRDAAQIVQQMFKPIGVTVKATPLDWGAIYKRMYGGKFDLASWGIGGSPEMGPLTRLTFHSKGAFNRSGYSNKIVDDLLIKQKISQDRETREKTLCEVARHVNDDAPFLYFCGKRHYLFSTRGVKGLPAPRYQEIKLEGVWLEKP